MITATVLHDAVLESRFLSIQEFKRLSDVKVLKIVCEQQRLRWKSTMDMK